MTSTTPRWRRTGVGRKRELPFNERTVEVARRLLANQEFQQLLDEVTSFALYFGENRVFKLRSDDTGPKKIV